jgi:TP901 family phage tail tape measure protein
LARGAIKGITVEIDGNTTKLNKALQDVNKTIRTSQEGLRDIEKLLKLDPGNVELLRQKQQYLGEAIEATREKIQTEEEALRQLESAGNSDATVEQQRALRREIEDLNIKLKSLETQARASASVLGAQMQAAGQKIQAAGQKIQAAGQSLNTHLTLPLLALGAAAVRVTAEFDESMSKVRALSGATGAEFDALRQKARDLGAATKFSASESADAMGELALAGWNTEQMLSGVDGVLDLAAASGLELAQAAGIVSGNLAAFNMEAEESSRLADILATAQAKSKTTAAEMGEAWNNSATTLTRAGQRVETTTALLEGMASVNDTGSASGTKLNAVMAQMTQKMKNGAIAIGDASVAVMDADGNFRDLIDILADIETATEGMGDAQRAAALQATFTRTSMQGLNELLAVGSGQLRIYRSELENSAGSAKEMAEVMQDNLAGQITVLKSQTQELGITMGDLLVPKAQALVSGIQEVVTAISAMDEGSRNAVVNMGLVAAAAGPVLTAVGKLTSGVGALVAAWGELVALGAAPALAVGGLAVGIGYLLANANAADPAVRALSDTTKEGAASTAELAAGISGVNREFSGFARSITGNQAAAETLIDKLIELAGAYDGSASAAAEIQHIVEQLNAAIPTLNLSFDEETGALSRTAEEMRQLNSEYAASEKYNAALERKAQAQSLYAQATEELTAREKELSDAQQAVAEYEEQWMDSLGNISGPIDDYVYLTDAVKTASSAVDTAREGVRRARGEMADAGRDIDTYGGSLETAAEAVAELTDGTEELEEETEGLGDAAEDTTKEMAELGYAAYDAITSGGDLRQTYEELSGQMDGLREGCDRTVWALTAEALETLNLAATNQELLRDYPALVSAVGDFGFSVTELSGWLIDNGITAQEWGSQVQSATSGIVNSFQLLDTDLDMSVSKMAENLQANLSAVAGWNTHMASLWAEAATYAGEGGQEAAMAFVQYLQDMGPAAAAQVAAMAGDLEGTMATFAPMFATAADQGVLEVYNSLTQGGTDASTASGTMMEAALAAAQAVTGWTEVGSADATEVASGITAGSGEVSGAAGTMMTAAYSAASGVGGWESIGSNIAAGVASGIRSGAYQAVNAAVSMVRQAAAAARSAGQINSPSRLFAQEVGHWIPAGVAAGIADNMEPLIAESRGMLQESLSAAQTAREAGGVSQVSGFGNGAEEALGLLRRYLPRIADMAVVLDGDATVGQLAPRMDTELRGRQTIAARGGTI